MANRKNNSEMVSLNETFLGYTICVDDESVGAIEGIPGILEYLVVEPPWENKGVARAALRLFIELSKEHGTAEVKANNAIHPAMEHILRTEGFEETDEGGEWVKEFE